MVTNPEEPEAPPTMEERFEGAARVLIAGHPQGAVRRIILYVLTFVLVVSPIPAVAILPLSLLALTDDLV